MGGSLGDLKDKLAKAYSDFHGKLDILNLDPFVDHSEDSKKPPKLKIDQDAANAAAQHSKDLLAVAFGLGDTKLTGQQGLGSVPKSLLTPKSTLGGY